MIINPILAVSGGGGSAVSVSPKEVNFYDYEGTLLHAYTVAEMQALTALPELPSHEGLVCQGWNWTLADLKATNRAMNVGAMYITDDGKTRLYIHIAAEGRMTVPLYLKLNTTSTVVTIDWGDGSASETLTGYGDKNTTHTYASVGYYVITLNSTGNSGFKFGNGTSSYCVMGSTANAGRVYCNMLKKVEIGRDVTDTGDYAFYNCGSLASITLSSSVRSIGGYAFRGCCSLTGIVFYADEDYVLNLYSYAFYDCHSLAVVSLPNCTIPFQFSTCLFYNCYSLTSVICKSAGTLFFDNSFCNCYSLTAFFVYLYGDKGSWMFLQNAFSDCTGMAVYDFSEFTSVPTLIGTDAFTNIPSDCVIKVPAALLDTWKAATNWSTYARYMVGV